MSLAERHVEWFGLGLYAPLHLDGSRKVHSPMRTSRTVSGGDDRHGIARTASVCGIMWLVLGFLDGKVENKEVYKSGDAMFNLKEQARCLFIRTSDLFHPTF
jgi:hypothetical protein